MTNELFNCDNPDCLIWYQNVDQRFRFHSIDKEEFSYCLGCATQLGVDLFIDIEDNKRLLHLVGFRMFTDPTDIVATKVSATKPVGLLALENETVEELAVGGQKVLVLCESGLVTSVILAKNLSEKYPANTYSTASIHSDFDEDSYDLLVTTPYLHELYSKAIKNPEKLVLIRFAMDMPLDRLKPLVSTDKIIDLLTNTDDLDKKSRKRIESLLGIFDLFDMSRRRQPGSSSDKMLGLPHGIGISPETAAAMKKQDLEDKSWKTSINTRHKRT